MFFYIHVLFVWQNLSTEKLRQENRILKRSITELVRHREEQQLTLQKTVAKFSSDQDNQRKFTFRLRQKIVKLSKKIMKLEEVHAVDTTMMELLKSKFQQLQQHVNDVLMLHLILFQILRPHVRKHLSNANDRWRRRDDHVKSDTLFRFDVFFYLLWCFFLYFVIYLTNFFSYVYNVYLWSWNIVNSTENHVCLFISGVYRTCSRTRKFRVSLRSSCKYILKDCFTVCFYL